jgi:hypothetical protein
MYETKFHTHVKQELKFWCCVFSWLYAYMTKGKRKVSGPNGAKHSLNFIWQALFFFGNKLFITTIFYNVSSFYMWRRSLSLLPWEQRALNTQNKDCRNLKSGSSSAPQRWKNVAFKHKKADRIRRLRTRASHRRGPNGMIRLCQTVPPDSDMPMKICLLQQTSFNWQKVENKLTKIIKQILSVCQMEQIALSGK